MSPSDAAAQEDVFAPLRMAVRLAGDDPFLLIALGEEPTAPLRLKAVLDELGPYAVLQLGRDDPYGPGPVRRLLLGFSELTAEQRRKELWGLNLARDRIRIDGLQVIFYVDLRYVVELSRAPDFTSWATETIRVPPPRERTC